MYKKTIKNRKNRKGTKKYKYRLYKNRFFIFIKK